ncbi:MAG: hypothetical protein FWD31_14755, partial [Planctomycetaceae bacterium]|nr:hypothetical protein [Planctomycetaceae bacterium]
MLRRLREGEKYPGRDFNRIVDAAEQMLERSESVPAVGPGKNPALIRVKNLSGENVPSFGVLRITGRLFPNAENPVTSALNGGVELKGEKPNEDDDQIVCITQEAIPDNALGRAVLWAATGVKVNVTDATHTHAKPIADDTRKLESTDSGAWRIVEKPDGTGEMF